jgi:hypothetical protein
MEQNFNVWLKNTEEVDKILSPLHIKLSKKVSYRNYKNAHVKISFYNAICLVEVPDRPISKIVDITIKSRLNKN